MTPLPAHLPAPRGAANRTFPTIATSRFDRIGAVIDAHQNRDGIWECANLRTMKPPRWIIVNGMLIAVPDDPNPTGGGAAAMVADHRRAA